MKEDGLPEDEKAGRLRSSVRSNMTANISDDELGLLAYLHENVMGYGEPFGIAPNRICSALNVTGEQLFRDTSYLAQHGLVGMKVLNTSGFGDGPAGSHSLRLVFLNASGEDYMRELERRPGMPKRITVAVLKEAGNALKDMAIKVLTEHLTGKI
jgi:hypothetical protein